MKLTKREILLLGLLLLAGGGWLTYRFIFEPFTLDKQQLLRENTLLTQEIRASVPTFKPSVGQQEEEELRGAYQQLRVKIPLNMMIADIIKYLEVSAQTNKVKLVSINYKEGTTPDSKPEASNPESGSPKVQKVRLQIIACGSHFNLLSYVLQLENAPRFYTINNLKLAVVKSQPVRSALQDDVLGQGLKSSLDDTTGTILPESLSYDPEQVILNLDFYAYYGGS